MVRIPYFVVGPGPARDVEPLIRVDGHAVYASRGHFLLTSVYFNQATVFGALGAWLDPARAVLAEHDVLAPGQTQKEEFQVALSEMDTSKIDAAIVALTAEAGYPNRHGKGALVERVYEGTPAEGKLFAGDVIVSVDGEQVEGPDDVGRHIRSAGVGRTLTFTVRPLGDSETRTVRLGPAKASGVDRPIIGVTIVANFPFPISIDSGQIGGPSAGLMWSLGLTDLLTPGDLTGGGKIAGTGTISLDGAVGPIGGVEQKVEAAEQAGAAIFLLPEDDAPAARSVADGIMIVPVRTYREAVRYLEAQG